LVFGTSPTITGGTVNPTTLQEGGVAAVVQTDVGTAPNQLPLNQYLGNLAYQDAANIAGPVGVGGGITAAGASVISVTDNTNAALRITQLGTGNALLVEDSANPDATPFVIDADGRVLLGLATSLTNAPDTGGTARAASFQQGAASFAGSTIQNAFYSASAAGGPVFNLAKSKGSTVGSFGLLSSTDVMGRLQFVGSDDTAFLRGASISGEVDGTPGTGSMPGRLVFSTTADGASTPTERMRINNAGNVGIGTASPNASAILDAQSTTKGVRMPNMTTTQKNDIVSPAAGLMVFDTTLAKLCVYSGAAWETITSL